MRRAIAAHLEQHLEGWRESRLSYDLIPDQGSRQDHDRRFAVGLPDSTALDGRQRGEMGVTTTVVIRWSVACKADRQRDAFDQALDQEEQILRVLAALKTADCPVPLMVTDMDRGVHPDGTILVGDITCAVTHRIPLS